MARLLLMLSLASLLAATAVAADDPDTMIRLPSDVQVAAAARPWKCCNAALCTKSIPPICHCADEVEQCPPTCKDCVSSTSHPSLHVCNDQYIGDPGPICRPWECCDAAICTRSIPPICRCRDVVDKCAATCKSCEASTSDPSRYVCEDIYRGFPGPMCTYDGNNGGNY